MENFLEELNLQRKATKLNIEKSFVNDIEKARSGVYTDTAENRKLQRVGQHYGSEKKQEEQPASRNTKPEENKSNKKNKGAKDSKRAEAFNQMSNEERDQLKPIFHLADWKRADLSSVRVSKPQDGWRTVTAAGNEIGKIKADDISDEVLKKIYWAEDEGGENKGKENEENNSSSDEVIDKWVDFWENNEDNGDYDDYQKNLEKFFLEIGEKIENGEIGEKKYSDYFDDNIGGDYTYEDVKRHYKSLKQNKRKGGSDDGYNKEALEKFKKNKVREYYNDWNKDTDMFVSKNKKYWEKTLKKEMGVDSYDDFEDSDDWKKYNKAVKIALNAIPAEKWAELADDDEKEKLKKEPKNKTASSLSQEEKVKKKSIRNKRNVIRALKTEVGGGNYLDSFLNENTEYFKDVLKKYSDDNVKDIYDLQEWLENRYENDEKDPYGYGRYDEIIYECLEKIPAEKFDNFKL